MMIFRKSVPEDVDAMVKIADDAKELLKNRGISQWQRGTYPDRKLFESDILSGIGYVVEEDGLVIAICALTLTDEDCYRHLENGAWFTSDDDCYVTVHRMAVALESQGKGVPQFLFDSAAEFGKENAALSIRADTHKDNKAMQKAMEKSGFKPTGEFYLTEGDEIGDLRIGYERLI